MKTMKRIIRMLKVKEKEAQREGWNHKNNSFIMLVFKKKEKKFI